MSDKTTSADSNTGSGTSERETSAETYRRGQVSPQQILGGIVLLVIAAPLASAASSIQSSFASISGFSWLTAWVIALLIVGAIVATALGQD